MTDKNQAALDALKRYMGDGPDGEDDPHNDNDTAACLWLSEHKDLVHKLLTATSAGVDVAPVRSLIHALECIIENDADDENLVVAEMALASYREYAQSIPDMREAWRPEEVTVDKVLDTIGTSSASAFNLMQMVAHAFPHGLRIKQPPKGEKS